MLQSWVERTNHTCLPHRDALQLVNVRHEWPGCLLGRTSNAVCSPKALSNSSRLISLPEEMSVTSPEPAD